VRPWLVALLALALLGAALRYGASPLGDYDLWWHLATGRELWRTGSLLPTDPFSFRALGQPWPYKDAGAELLLYGLYALGGSAALLAWKAAGVLAVVTLSVLTARGRGAPPWLALGLGGLTLEVAAFRLIERPQLFAFVATAGLILVLERRRGETRLPLGPLLLIAVTANLHRSVWLLPPLLGLDLVERVQTRRRTAGLAGLAGWRAALSAERAAALGVLAAPLAALATPFGLAGLRTSGDTISTELYARFLPEWHAVSVAGLSAAAPATFALLALVLAALVTEGRRAGAFALGLAALGLLLGLSRMRFVPYAALFTTPLLGAAAARLGARLTSGRAARLASALALAFAALTLGMAARSPLPLPGTLVLERLTPQRALDYADEKGVRGRVLNALHHGGYLLLHAWPERLASMDGRSDSVYTPAQFEEAVRVFDEPALLAAVTARVGIEWLLLGNSGDAPARLHLERSGHFALVHATDASLLYLRRGGENAALAERDAFRVLSPHALADSLLGALSRGGASAEAARREVARLVELDPEGYRANVALAVLYGATGDPRAARQLERARALQSRR
jgi:hypothetical protein